MSGASYVTLWFKVSVVRYRATCVLYKTTATNVRMSKRKREADEPYEQMKQRHETECFKLSNHVGQFAIIYADSQLVLPKSLVIKCYSDVYGCTDQPDFIQRWVRDPCKKVLKTLVMDPSCTCGESVYNLWKPFRASQLAPVDDSQELTHPIVDYIVNHIASGDKGSAEWILNYLARMVQFPGSKSEMAIWLHGDERCCKRLLFDFMCEQVLGPYHSRQINNQSFSETYAVRRVCIQVHGVKQLHKSINRLIMMKTLYVGSPNIRVDNLVNLVIMSNKPPAEQNIHISEFHCSAPSDLEGLRAHLSRSEVARAFYQFLLARPLPALAEFHKFMRHSRPRQAINVSLIRHVTVQ